VSDGLSWIREALDGLHRVQSDCIMQSDRRPHASGRGRPATASPDTVPSGEDPGRRASDGQDGLRAFGFAVGVQSPDREETSMTRVIIEGLVDRRSLLSAISAVLEVLNHDDAYLEEEQVFIPGGGAVPDPMGVSGGQSTRPIPLPDQPQAIGPLIPCPRRGIHTRLADCWMCWCDVMRGVALEPEVVTTAEWTDGLEFRA
jgi:hypothetical protein